jgi:hypothetical protein
MQHKTPPPTILQGNTCILVDVYDREVGKGGGASAGAFDFL